MRHLTEIFTLKRCKWIGRGESHSPFQITEMGECLSPLPIQRQIIKKHKKMELNKLIGIGLIALSTCGGFTFLESEDEKEQLVVHLTNPAKPGKLTVGLINGDIHVIGYDGKDVIIDAVQENDSKNNHRKGNSNKEGMKRITPNDGFEITAEEDNNNVTVETDEVNKVINLTIKVPKRFSLKLNTVNHGEIIVENVSGNFELGNVNGGIKMKNVSGSALATTINGDLIADFDSILTGTPMAFTTLNGDVNVTLPPNVKANIKMQSEMGEIYSDFDIDINKSASKTSHTTEKGVYKIVKDKWTYGKINGGGAEILMKNMHGDVNIRKGK